MFLYFCFWQPSGSLVSCYWIQWKWFGKDTKESDFGLIECTIPAFYWRNWGNPREMPVRIVGTRTEIRTKQFQDFTRKRHHFGELALYAFCLQKLYYNCGVTSICVSSTTKLRSQGSLCNSYWSPKGFWQRVCTLLTESLSFVTVLLVEIVRKKNCCRGRLAQYQMHPFLSPRPCCLPRRVRVRESEGEVGWNWLQPFIHIYKYKG
jgi:hypothetical protein